MNFSKTVAPLLAGLAIAQSGSAGIDNKPIIPEGDSELTAHRLTHLHEAEFKLNPGELFSAKSTKFKQGFPVVQGGKIKFYKSLKDILDENGNDCFFIGDGDGCPHSKHLINKHIRKLAKDNPGILFIALKPCGEYADFSTTYPSTPKNILIISDPNLDLLANTEFLRTSMMMVVKDGKPVSRESIGIKPPFKFSGRSFTHSIPTEGSQIHAALKFLGAKNIDWLSDPKTFDRYGDAQVGCATDRCGHMMALYYGRLRHSATCF